MDPGFTAEQDGIRRTLRDLLHKRCGPGELRAALDTPRGHDPALWAALAEQLGLPGLALPEAYGGVGCPVTDLALAAEETGRALAPSPLLATSVLAAPLILALGTDAQRADLLPRISGGTLTAALAVPAPALAAALDLTGPQDGDWAGGGRAGGIQARRAEGVWRLYGEAAQVLDGHSAGALVVAAHTGGFVRSRTLLFVVAGDAAGLVRTRQTALDATRPQARVQLRDVRAELLGVEQASTGEALARAGDFAAAFLACEAVGAADRALERTVDHLGRREQFGRVIGSFQAVQHRLADVYVQIQAARSAAYYAAWAAAGHGAEGGPDGPESGSGAGGRGGCAGPGGAGRRGERVGGLALAQALEALRRAAAEGIQLHGGIGFTWEHEAHLFFKRAAGDELLFGPVHRLRAHAAEGARLFERTEVPV
ncbi:acyl-CoA dehydrogenase family protein [Streptomyces sp. 3330]|uniref:acyl-CoA dehydrogenase family protein n=1 Tax=Streptomyces sp. 3330 TaxID=2817755 RepID=UPI00286AF7DE|nr:acyl-CoA dehydrogenase family protein [Streptomyces sp. 3330]